MTPTDTAAAIAHADKMQATMEHLLGDGAIGAIHGLELKPYTDLPDLRLKLIEMIGTREFTEKYSPNALNLLDFLERYVTGGVEAVRDFQFMPPPA